jgi:uncharacterized protein (TIGR00645 family)
MENCKEEQCKESPVKRIVENILFGSRWLLVLFYSGLIVAMCAYAFTYILQIVHLIGSIGRVNSDGIMMIILELIDMVMIASLVKMMITGSYHAFIDKHHHYLDEKASSGFLKIKIATSLIGVSAIHLLQSFMTISGENLEWDKIYKQLIIHGAFLLGALVLAVVEYLHDKTLADQKQETN